MGVGGGIARGGRGARSFLLLPHPRPPPFDQTPSNKRPPPIRKNTAITNNNYQKKGPAAAARLFDSIQSLVVNSLLAAQPAVIHDRHCFELYGYDVLVDSKLKPWLLEVNASPSLSASDRGDWELKFCMLNVMIVIARVIIALSKRVCVWGLCVCVGGVGGEGG